VVEVDELVELEDVELEVDELVELEEEAVEGLVLELVEVEVVVDDVELDDVDEDVTVLLVELVVDELVLGLVLDVDDVVLVDDVAVLLVEELVLELVEVVLEVVVEVVVVVDAGQPCIVTRWMCRSLATKVPTRFAPLFTWSEAFGAHSASRMSAFRWIVTIVPLTRSSTSQGEMVAFGAGPTNVELLNFTSPTTLMVAGDSNSTEFRETWRPQKT